MKQLDSTTFKQTLADNTWTLVDFFTTWCPPCKLLKPVLASLETELPEINFCTLDIEEAEDIGDEYDVQSVPTLILFKGSTIVDQKLGAAPKKELTTWLKGHIQKA